MIIYCALGIAFFVCALEQKLGWFKSLYVGLTWPIMLGLMLNHWCDQQDKENE